MMITRLALLSALSAATVHYAEAFTPSSGATVGWTSCQLRTFSPACPSLAVAMAADTDTATTSSDVSVPYDAAARLAYKEWIAQYGRPYDESRYQVFQSNYNAITVMNVSAKKAARDASLAGGGAVTEPTLLLLNEYADFTAEEYEAAMSGGGAGGSSSSSTKDPTSTGDILGEAVASVQTQAAASSALQDAADALAEEEAVSDDNNDDNDVAVVDVD